MSRPFSVVALVTVLGLVTASAILAEEKPKPKEAPKPAAAKQAAVGRGRSGHQKGPRRNRPKWSFIETPLCDVIDYLKDHHHIEIQLDNKALGDVGIGSDTPVTKNIKGTTLRSALRLLLHELNLTYMIHGRSAVDHDAGGSRIAVDHKGARRVRSCGLPRQG